MPLRSNLALAAAAVAAVATAGGPFPVLGNDVSFTSGDYTISLIGASGKLRFETGDGRFLQLAQHDLEEVEADGGSLSPAFAVPSWASQDFTWTNATATCGTKGENAAIRFCERTTVKVGNNGASAPTADIYVQGELTDASYYHDCDCGLAAAGLVKVVAADPDDDEIRKPFDDNYDPSTDGYCLACGSACVTCDTSLGVCSAAAHGDSDACDGENQYVVTSAATADPNTDTAAANLCALESTCACIDGSAAAQVACDGTCAGTLVTGVALADNADLATASDFAVEETVANNNRSCEYQPDNRLKFTTEVNNWPWKTPTVDNLVAYSFEVKGSSDGERGADESDDAGEGGDETFRTDDGLNLVSSRNYIRCMTTECGSWSDDNTPTACGDDNDDDCCVVEDGVCGPDGCTPVVQGSKTIVTYVFLESTGATGICYDPSIGEASETSAAASAASGGLHAAAVSVGLAAVLLAW